jgi:hypothetical protein
MAENSTELAIVRSPKWAEMLVKVSEASCAIEELVVNSPETFALAGELKETVGRSAKMLSDLQDAFTRPLNEKKQSYIDACRPFLLKLDGLKRMAGEKAIAWKKEQDRAAAAAAKQRKAEEDAKAEAERIEAAAKKSGAMTQQQVLVPPPMPKAAPVAYAPTTIKTSTGRVAAVHKDWKLEVVDVTKLPREFMVADMPALNAAVRRGARSIEGCRIFEVESLR